MSGYRKLGKATPQRKAMLRGLVTDCIKYERITTTLFRAKEVRREVEKMITIGKKGTLHDRRRALSYIYDKGVVEKLFSDIAPRYENRNGGYTRIYKLGTRRGDGAEEAILELVEGEKPATDAE